MRFVTTSRLKSTPEATPLTSMLSVRTDAYLDAYEIKITRKNGPVDACTLKTAPTPVGPVTGINDSVLP